MHFQVFKLLQYKWFHSTIMTQKQLTNLMGIHVQILNIKVDELGRCAGDIAIKEIFTCLNNLEGLTVTTISSEASAIR